MPKPAPEKADELAELDPDLLPQEQAYVNHYLGYADILLHEKESDIGNKPQVTEQRNTRSGAPAELRKSGVIELPKMQEPKANENGNHNKDAA